MNLFKGTNFQHRVYVWLLLVPKLISLIFNLYMYVPNNCYSIKNIELLCGTVGYCRSYVCIRGVELLLMGLF